MQGNRLYAGDDHRRLAGLGAEPRALLVLWFRRPHSVLDLWLMVVMSAWLADIALAAMLNGGRFDLGFYAGRIFGLLAASFVLVMLLLETGALYTQLARMLELERARAADEISSINAKLATLLDSAAADLHAGFAWPYCDLEQRGGTGLRPCGRRRGRPTVQRRLPENAENGSAPCMRASWRARRCRTCR